MTVVRMVLVENEGLIKKAKKHSACELKFRRVVTCQNRAVYFWPNTRGFMVNS